MSKKTKNLITRTLTGIVFLAAMIGGMASNGLTFTLLFSVITALTLWEYAGLVNTHAGVRVNRFISSAAGVYLFWAMVYYVGHDSRFFSGGSGFFLFAPYVFTLVYLLIGGLYSQGGNVITDWAYTMFGQVYVAWPFMCLVPMVFWADADGGFSYHGTYALSIFIFLWCNDTGAYCSGSLFGKHKLFPRISPSKTWEGSVGGVVFVLMAAIAIWWFADLEHNSVQLFKVMGLGVVVAVVGTWGDLVESLLKRTLGVKDSGTILPGHGGMLDRFDSSLLAIPAALVYHSILLSLNL